MKSNFVISMQFWVIRYCFYVLSVVACDIERFFELLIMHNLIEQIHASQITRTSQYRAYY